MTDTTKGMTTLRSVAVRSLGVVLMIGALAAGAFSLRTAALTHLGVMARAPAVEFEIRLPPAMARTDLKRDAQVELLTDLNQTLAQLDGDLRATEDGRAVLRGHVPLKFRTYRCENLNGCGQPRGRRHRGLSGMQDQRTDA